MKFTNRIEELKSLEQLYKLSKTRSIMAVLTGRRRVGKTELIKRFFEGRDNCIYLFVEKKPSNILLADYAKVFSDILKMPVKFDNWDEFIEFIFQYSRENQIVIAFDEFQYFWNVDRSIFSIIQKHWDDKRNKSRLFLIFTGSLMGLMKNIFLDNKEPLYGRVHQQFVLRPLRYAETRDILHNFGTKIEKEIVEIFSVFGGIPKYYVLLEDFALQGKSVFSILDELLFKANAPLENEVKYILLQEFGKEHESNFSILEGISSGKCTVVEIANYIGLNTTSLSPYLKNLTQYYGFIRRIEPVTEKKRGKMTRYFLNDNFLKFWFKNVYRNLSFYEIGNYGYISDEIKKNFSSDVGIAFEGVVKELLLSYNGKHPTPLHFSKIGSWWNRRGDEIDIVAINEKTKDILFCECKWTERKTDKNVLGSLLGKKELVNWYNKKRREHYMVVSKKGFTKSARKIMDSENIIGMTLKDVEVLFDKLTLSRKKSNTEPY